MGMDPGKVEVERKGAEAPIKSGERFDSADVAAMGGRGGEVASRKRSGEGMRERERKLLQGQKMESMGMLVSGVAHEINNLIGLLLFNTAIVKNVWNDFLPLLEKQAEIEPNRKYGGLHYDYLKKEFVQLLLDMEMASERMADITRRIKDFSRRTDIADKTRMRINDAVENAINLARGALKRSDIAVRTDLGKDIPFIEGHLQSIEQVVLNLLLNAAQAMEGHGG